MSKDGELSSGESVVSSVERVSSDGLASFKVKLEIESSRPVSLSAETAAGMKVLEAFTGVVQRAMQAELDRAERMKAGTELEMMKLKVKLAELGAKRGPVGEGASGDRPLLGVSDTIKRKLQKTISATRRKAFVIDAVKVAMGDDSPDFFWSTVTPEDIIGFAQFYGLSNADFDVEVLVKELGAPEGVAQFLEALC